MQKKGKGQGVTGTAVTPSGKDGFSLISNDKLLELYANLLKCRIVEQRAVAQQKTSRAKARSLPGRGCEAGTVGVTIDLGSEDIVSSMDHVALTAYSHDALIEALRDAFGTGSPPKEGQSQPSQSNAAKRNGVSAERQNIHAVIGAALASKTEKNGKVAVVFGGNGEGEEWNRAIQIASAHGLPMIFVNQQTRSASPANRTRTEETSKFDKPETPSFPRITVDGHDVVAVYRVAYEAISRARQGRGPTLIDCRPFLPSGKVAARHSLNGSAGNQRHVLDSVSNMEKYLRGKGLFNRELKTSIIANFKRVLDAAQTSGGNGGAES